MRAMIMAAGMGKRLEPLTFCKAKPMVTVGNAPVMEHILKLLKKYNITEVIANTHYLAGQLTDYFINNPIEGMKLEFLHEEKLSGTAGGVKKCEWFINQNDTFIVMSGDSLTDVNLHDLIKKHKESKAIATMALKRIPKEEVIHMGVVVTNGNGKVLEFQEKPTLEEAKSDLVNTGIYIFEPEIFDYIPTGIFYDFAKQVFPRLMKDNKPIYGFEINEYWNDIGTLKQYRLSTYDALEGIVSIDINGTKFENGWIGKNTTLGKNLSFESNILIGNNCNIGDEVSFINNVTVGNNSKIGYKSKLDGCLIWDNTIIEENCTLNKCIIGSNVHIGKNTIIQNNVIIADNCTIQENSVVKEGTKLNPNEEFCREKTSI